MILIWTLRKGLEQRERERERVIVSSSRPGRLLGSGRVGTEPGKMERRWAGVEKYPRRRSRILPGSRRGQGILGEKGPGWVRDVCEDGR